MGLFLALNRGEQRSNAFAFFQSSLGFVVLQFARRKMQPCH